jgi:hypothetical protein
MAVASMDHRGIDAVLKDMRQHPKDAKVQEKGCKALADLALNADNAVKIGARSGVEAIVQAMGGHRGSEGVQRGGCEVLMRLTFNADILEKVGAEGGVEAIMQAMGGHRGSEGVQREAANRTQYETLEKEHDKDKSELATCTLMAKLYPNHTTPEQTTAPAAKSPEPTYFSLSWPLLRIAVLVGVGGYVIAFAVHLYHERRRQYEKTENFLSNDQRFLTSQLEMSTAYVYKFRSQTLGSMTDLYIGNQDVLQGHGDFISKHLPTCGK